MSKQQLYINDVAVDMPSDTIKIRVASNIMADITKVMTAHSYSIHLPRTMTNDNVFALAYVSGADTGGISTHCYLKASLYMDGIPIFEGGKAVLNSVDDKGYNLNLYWGLIDIFDEIKTEGLQLNELPLSKHWNESTMAIWDTLTKFYLGDDPPIYDGGMDTTIYNNLTTDSKALADTKPWTMPFVQASTIMNKIASVYGLTFSYSSEFSNRMNQLVHPLTTLNAMAKGEVLDFKIGAQYIVHENDYNRKNLTLGVPRDANNGRFLGNAIYMETDSAGYRFMKAKHKINVKEITIKNARCDKEFVVGVYNAKLSERAIESTYNSQTGYYEIAEHTWREIVCEADDPVLDLSNPAGVYWTSGETPDFDIDFTLVIDDIAEVSVGDMWCFERNYPSMKVYDYIGEILAHCGGCIIGSVTKPSAIRIVTLDDIMGNAPIAYDIQGVQSITMSIDDLAQRNIYTHKANEDNSEDGLEAYNAEGAILTEDETLELEREAYKSNFKVPRQNLVKLWKVEKQDDSTSDKASWNNAGDYICGYNDDPNPEVSNTGQDFQSIIDAYYTNYAEIAKRPKAVEVVVRLGSLDLIDFDFEHPAYIPQLNRAYIITSIESDNNEKYKLKLMQI